MSSQSSTWKIVNYPNKIGRNLGPVHMNPGSELPRGNDCPGASVTSRSHDDLLSRGNVAPGQLHCPGASSSSSDHYEFIRIPLVFTQIVTENEF